MKDNAIDGELARRPPGRTPKPATVKGMIAVLFAGLVATTPFLNKAYHIDDVLYLRVADQILRSPLHPYDGMVLWDAPDGQPGKLFETDFNPPLWKYILAGTMAVAGREEWKLHLAEALFVILSGLGVYRLSARFSDRPIWCALAILWAPFFLPGLNIMLEGPMLCFCVWAMVFQFRAWDEDRMRWSWLAGLAFAAAVLTKYTAGLLLPIFFVASLWARKPKSLVAFVPPALGLVAWIVHNRLVYGQAHFGAHGFVLGAHEMLVRFRSVVRCVGAVFWFGPLLAAIMSGRGKIGRIGLLGCAVAALGFAIAELRWLKDGISYGEGWSPTGLQTVHYAVFAFQGFFVLAALAAIAAMDWSTGRRCWRTFDDRTLMEIIAAAYLAFNVFCVPFNAVRHLLLAFVPMTWLAAEGLTGRAAWPRLQNLTLIASSALGFALAAADYEIAGTYQSAARDIVGRWVQGGNTVWFAGNWGFVHYANLAGGNPLVQNPPAYGLPMPKEGDIIVHPRLLTWKYLPLPAELAAVTALEHHQPLPVAGSYLRTLAPSVHYYSQVGETLPWEVLVFPPDSDEKKAWFQPPPLDDILVYRIERRPTNRTKQP